MRIGIDCRTITKEKTGIGYYTYYLVKGLIEIYPNDKFVLFFADSAMAQKFKSENVEIKYFIFSKYEKFLPFFYSHILTAIIIGLAKIEIFHGPANVLPLFYIGKSVLTIHDLAIYRHPRWFPGGQGFATDIVVPQSIRKAQKIIAVSRATKKDLVELFKVPENKIEVIYEGVDLEKFKPRENNEIIHVFGVDKPYLLFLGTLEPRKNLVRLIQAFSNSLELANSYQLVIAGRKGWYYDQIFEEVKKRSLQNQVLFTGYISEDEKIKIMQGASAFIFPSLYEGFGLPVLEAMACGTPVACSSNFSLPEVGGQAAVYFDAEDTASIAKALENIFNDPGCFRDKGLERAKNFSWSKAVEETYKNYLLD